MSGNRSRSTQSCTESSQFDEEMTYIVASSLRSSGNRTQCELFVEDVVVDLRERFFVHN